MEVWIAERYVNSLDKSAGIDQWFYIISKSFIDARNIFIDCMKKELIEDYYLNFDLPYLTKRLQVWSYACGFANWKLTKLKHIEYKGKTRGIKSSLTDNIFSYKA